MTLLANIQVALEALRVNRMRSALAMLVIIIGVAAVIAMVAIGSGATARIEAQIQSIGSAIGYRRTRRTPSPCGTCRRCSTLRKPARV